MSNFVLHVHACMHAYIHTYRHTDIQTYRQTDKQTDIQTRERIYVYKYLRKYTNIDTYPQKGNITHLKTPRINACLNITCQYIICIEERFDMYVKIYIICMYKKIYKYKYITCIYTFYFTIKRSHLVTFSEQLLWALLDTNGCHGCHGCHLPRVDGGASIPC